MFYFVNVRQMGDGKVHFRIIRKRGREREGIYTNLYRVWKQSWNVNMSQIEDN